MPTFKDLNSLMAHVKKMAMDAARDEGAKQVIKTQIKHNESDIYNYSPSVYNRRGTLRRAENFVVDDIDDDTISVYNDEEPDYAVVDGYDSSQYQLQWLVEEGASPAPFGEGVWTEPRPAVKNTYEDLKNGNELISAVKSGLKKRGLTVK